MPDRDPLTDRVNALAARYRERALERVPPDFNEPPSDLLAVLDEEGEEGD